MTGKTWLHVLAPPVPPLLLGSTPKTAPPAPPSTGPTLAPALLPLLPLRFPPAPTWLEVSGLLPAAEHAASASGTSTVKGKARIGRVREDKRGLQVKCNRVSA